jgi:hypothetical protein
MSDKGPLPRRLIRFCGADCSQCETYRRFLAGDASGVVNPETGYRCCWLPKNYSKGRDCPIRECCGEKGLLFCGECAQFQECTRMAEFYAQSGYDKLRERMLEEVAKKRGSRREIFEY